ncbi:MAG: PEP-CTERM-box response regulator transcription factor [bacterium]
MNKPKLLVVDDEEYICKQIKWGLNTEYEVIIANDANDAIKKFNGHKPDVITLDLNLSPADDHKKGFMVLEKIIAADPHAKVVMVTGHDGKENAINSLRLGSYDYYVKPIDLNELKIILKRALYIRNLELENKKLQSQIVESGDSYGILGNCRKIKEVINLIRRVAEADIAVLIHGESGTGKELAARAIHRLSKRADEAFIPIDSGAIPETLLESELFGHEKGAFTDAHTKKIGKVELAHKGTLFFDEIAELPLNLQVKLLRFLQERKIQRLGGSEFIPVDVRVIAASNKSLEQEIKEKNFREDIYYRLNGITIELPPLREREDDIIFIANHFLEKFSIEMRKNSKQLAPESIKAMKAYSWPGNIRELENKIKRALVMSTERYIKPHDLGISYNRNYREDLTLKEAKEKLEKEMLIGNLERHNGNLSKISKGLGIARSTIYDLIDKYGIDYKKENKKYNQL